jgi:hypothetical protein
MTVAGGPVACGRPKRRRHEEGEDGDRDETPRGDSLLRKGTHRVRTRCWSREARFGEATGHRWSREARFSAAWGGRELGSPLVDGGHQSSRFSAAAGGETRGGCPAVIRRGNPWRSRRRRWSANPSSVVRLGENTAGVHNSSGRIEKKAFRVYRRWHCR